MALNSNDMKEKNTEQNSIDNATALSVENETLAEENYDESKSEKTSEESFSTHIVDETISTMFEKVRNKLFSEKSFICNHSSKSDEYLQSIKEVSVNTFEKPEIGIAMLSGVSGGKSSYTNVAICKYPIIPVASTTTSICPVEIRKANTFDDEMLEVCALTEDKKSLEKEPIIKFKKMVLNEDLFKKLLDYTEYLSNERILEVSDGISYFYDDNDNICLNRKNWRHCLMLLMILFDAYVFQDKQDDSSLNNRYKVANEIRNKLLEELHVPVDIDYGLRLFWCSDKVPENTFLIDLPGTGSQTVATKSGQASHTELVNTYLSKVSSVICFFDDTATMGSETKTLLESFISTNKLKGTASALITFVLNKGDKYDSKYSDNKKDADNAIKTAISAFRQSFPISEKYPVYTLSTFDGEWLLLQSDVSYTKTHHARDFISNYRRYTRQEPTENLILENQKTRYERAYPYQNNSESDYGSMDFESFGNKFFFDYVRRIQFLSSVDCFRDFLDSVKLLADLINAEKAMLKIASDYSPELASLIASSIRCALGDEIEDLFSEFQNLNSNMQLMISDASQKLNIVVKQFDDDYSVLSSVINSKIQNTISGLETNRFGNIPLEKNRFGGNEIGKRNHLKIMSLADSISKISYISYFQKSFNMLENEFNREKNLYDESIDVIVESMMKFPDKVIKRMTDTFEKSVKDNNLSEVAGFKKAFDIALKATNRLINATCKDFAKQFKSDTSIDDVISETTEKIRKDLLDLLYPYTSSNYGSIIIEKISNDRYFRANTVNEQYLKDFLNEHYVSNFRHRMNNCLENDIKGSGALGIEKSHFFRMNTAIEQISKKYLSKEATKNLKDKVDSACDVTDEILKDPKYLEEWKNALVDASKDMQQFIDDDSPNKFFEKISPLFAKEVWAADVIEKTNAELSETQEHIEQLLLA